MIDEARIYCDEDGWHLVLEGDMTVDGELLRHNYSGALLNCRLDPQLLDDALTDWRNHIAEGEAVRQERLAAGSRPWHEVIADDLDESAESLRALGDQLRKEHREGVRA
jgi:hypothetical protein